MTTTAMATAVKREFGSLVGKTIKTVRPLTPAEFEMFGWDAHSGEGLIIIFTDNTCVIPMSDPEGNDAGWLELAKVG